MKRMVVLLLVVSILASGTAACRARPSASPPMPTPSPAATPSTVPPGSEVVFEFSAVDARGRAVAFHSIDLIDAEANTLGTLELGTPETDARQGEGWLETDTSPQVGAFQWAGGPDGRATLRLDLPDGTEGLLLHVNSVQNGLWMTVTVGSEPAAMLRTDDYWHLGYVPLGEATPALTPDAEPEWLEGHYFPAFPPPPGRIYAIRVRTALEDWLGAPSSQDWRVNQSFDTMMALTLVGMQGVINRSGPAVYLDWVDGGPRRDVLHAWIPRLQAHADVVELDLDGLSAFRFLWRRFAPRFQGAVVYVPDVPDTINLATMVAGLEDRVILAPEQLDLLASPMPGMPPFDSLYDLRPLAREQGWDTSREGRYRLYGWVYDNLWPRLEKRGIGVISPGPPTTAMDGGRYDPLGLAPRDYLVALRLPALWFSPAEEPEAGLFSRFLEEAPSPIPVFSFYDSDEVGTVALASRYGDWVPVIPNTNTPLAAGNLTAFAGLRPPLMRYESPLDPQRILASLGDRPVVTLWNSDGDALHIQMDRGIHGGPDFTWDGVRGSHFGWSINPTLAELAPLAWNDYVGSANGTSFVSALSGAGYAYPQLMDDAQLDAYLAHTARYLELTGLRTVMVDERSGEFDERLAGKYYQHLKPAGLLGILAGFSGPGDLLPVSYPGVPLPVVRNTYFLRPGNGEQILQALLAARPGEIRLDLMSDDGSHQGQVVLDESASGGQAVRFARPLLPPCCMVIASARTTLAPGQYTVTYRLKVPDNRSHDPFAQLLVLRQVAGGERLTSRYLTPTDFQQAGQYQDLSLSFTLDRFTTDIQFWMDYYGGTSGYADTELFADTVLVSRAGGGAFPPFAPIFIGLVGPTEPMNEDLRVVTEEFERAGGVVLHPDEFVAALNPEFMIEWAAPILGAEHPALALAQAQLQDGAFFDSLLTVRAALRNLPTR